MTKFSDQLFDDLMEEHGHTLAGLARPAAPKRHLAARPVLLTAGAGGIAAITAVGTLVAGGGTPAYAVTPHDDGTVTLAVYQKDGIAPANDKLRRSATAGWCWSRWGRAARASPRLSPASRGPKSGPACG